MEKYRKNTVIEVIERHYQDELTGDKGVLVQNEGDSSDRWVIPEETFRITYERVG